MIITAGRLASATLLVRAVDGILGTHRVLLCIAHDPGVRLRDIAARINITGRSAYSIVTDLTEAGYVVKDKDGRRNRYQIQAHPPRDHRPGAHDRRDPGAPDRR